MIEISDLKFQYDAAEFQLLIPKLSIKQGERVAIVGPSGAGKTTLLMLLSGVLTPDSGFIRVGTEVISSLHEKDRRRFRISNVGFVFQEFELLEYLNVQENILLPFLINRSLKLDDKARAIAIELAQSLGLGNKLRQHPSKLSHGERQRVAICRAMVTTPSLVLADEPTGSLDQATASGMLDLLLSHTTEKKATLLCVTHDDRLLKRFDRTIDITEFSQALAGSEA